MAKFILFLSLLTFAFDKADFFGVIQLGEENKLEVFYTQISENLNGLDSLAYLGTLKMRHADAMSGPVRKLRTFKDGHELLETAIKEAPEKVEYRFLRLIIQKNAPDFLNYNDNIEEDAALIKKYFEHTDGALKNAITDFASKSEVLDF